MAPEGMVDRRELDKGVNVGWGQIGLLRQEGFFDCAGLGAQANANGPSVRTLLSWGRECVSP